MAESSNDVSGDLLLRVRCFFFFFNMPMHSLPPWQLKEEDHHGTPLHLAVFFVFTTSSSICRCVPSASPPTWQHLAAASPSAMAKKCPLRHGKEEEEEEVGNIARALLSDEGENWSVGQRQLFCLGRVLPKRNRILVLDEATASIDSATDAILQRVIREEFSECTVITVAHRVPTVIDSDMVMVLSYGKLIEYDEPSKLMERDSSFYKPVSEYWSNCNKNVLQKD
nr:ABC transporter C family member 8-like [Arachis hypogaea]